MAAKKDGTSDAQGRFVVSLPKELGTEIDAIGDRIKTAVREQSGVEFELTRSQVVQSLVKSALASDEAKADAPAAR